MIIAFQVLSGSHKVGRIDHIKMSNGQYMADMKRVEALKERCPLVYCEMEPGKKRSTYDKTWRGIDTSKHHYKKGNSVHISSNKCSHDCVEGQIYK